MIGKCTFVLLPGLDGTGNLFKDFANELSSCGDVRIIDFPSRRSLNYDQLADYVRQRLPTSSYVLIGESFSGPVALKVASTGPPNLRGVVLGASFARLGFPFKGALSFAANFVPPRLVPNSLLAFFLLGRWTNQHWAQELSKALAAVEPRVLTARAKEALLVDLIADGIQIKHPVLYLQAGEDRLIPKSAMSEITLISDSLRVERIAAPHFLFQIQPSACAAAICNFAAELHWPALHTEC